MSEPIVVSREPTVDSAPLPRREGLDVQPARIKSPAKGSGAGY
jgi:hypothetical protein